MFGLCTSYCPHLCWLIVCPNPTVFGPIHSNINLAYSSRLLPRFVPILHRSLSRRRIYKAALSPPSWSLFYPKGPPSAALPTDRAVPTLPQPIRRAASTMSLPPPPGELQSQLVSDAELKTRRPAAIENAVEASKRLAAYTAVDRHVLLQHKVDFVLSTLVLTLNPRTSYASHLR